MHLAWALCICASAAATEPQQGELVAALTSLQKKFDGLEGFSGAPVMKPLRAGVTIKLDIALSRSCKHNKKP